MDDLSASYFFMPHVPTTNQVVSAILTLYTSLSVKVHGRYTILAAFVLCNSWSNDIKIISLSTGSKCLPTVKLPDRGESLHDSHAEVLARRGAIRWFLQEIGRTCANSTFQSDWIMREDGQFMLKKGVEVLMYISTIPCEISLPECFSRILNG